MKNGRSWFWSEYSAFTLVELVVVITILAILGTVGFLSLGGMTKDAKNARTTTNLRQIADKISTDLNTEQRIAITYSGAMAVTGSMYSGQTLVPGAYPTVGSNYSVGYIDYSKLGIDGTKFEDVPNKFLMGSAIANPVAGLFTSVNQTFQVAGTVDIGGKDYAVVHGTYAKYGATDVSGLIYSTLSSGTITDGGTNLAYNINPVVAPPAPLVNGACGTASGGYYSSAPTGGVLCSAGTASAVTGTYSWNCVGSGLGTTASCGATYVAAYNPATVYASTNRFSWTGSDGTSSMIVYVLGPGIGYVVDQFAATGTGATAGQNCGAEDVAVWSGANIQAWAGCNVGATTPPSYAARNTSVTGNAFPDSTEITKWGYYFQWGNNGFDPDGLTTSNVQVNAAWAAASSYYNSVFRIINWGTWARPADWSSGLNDNLWGNTDNTRVARKWPCPTGYHVPTLTSAFNTSTEFGVLYTIINGYALTGGGSPGMVNRTGESCTGIANTPYLMECLLRMPSMGNRSYNGVFGYQWEVTGAGNGWGWLWSSSPVAAGTTAYYVQITAGISPAIPADRSVGLPVRCIKN